MFLIELKDIAALIETGAYTREVRRIVRAIRWTVQLRKTLNASVLSTFLNCAFVPGSEVHSRLAAYIPKVRGSDLPANLFNTLVLGLVYYLEVYVFLVSVK